MPTIAHIIYIPAIFLFGIIIGYILASRGRNADEEDDVPTVKNKEKVQATL